MLLECQTASGQKHGEGGRQPSRFWADASVGKGIDPHWFVLGDFIDHPRGSLRAGRGRPPSISTWPRGSEPPASASIPMAENPRGSWTIASAKNAVAPAPKRRSAAASGVSLSAPAAAGFPSPGSGRPPWRFWHRRRRARRGSEPRLRHRSRRLKTLAGPGGRLREKRARLEVQRTRRRWLPTPHFRTRRQAVFRGGNRSPPLAILASPPASRERAGAQAPASILVAKSPRRSWPIASAKSVVASAPKGPTLRRPAPPRFSARAGGGLSCPETVDPLRGFGVGAGVPGRAGAPAPRRRSWRPKTLAGPGGRLRKTPPVTSGPRAAPALPPAPHFSGPAAGGLFMAGERSPPWRF